MKCPLTKPTTERDNTSLAANLKRLARKEMRPYTTQMLTTTSILISNTVQTMDAIAKATPKEARMEMDVSSAIWA